MERRFRDMDEKKQIKNEPPYTPLLIKTKNVCKSFQNPQKPQEKEKKRGPSCFLFSATTHKKKMPCDDCDMDPCECGLNDDNEPQCPSDCEPSCSDSEGEDDDCGCESSGEDDNCERGPQGVQGPPGPSGGGQGFASSNTASYARFYGLTTDEKHGVLIPHGAAVVFPSQNTIVGNAIQRASQTEFLLKRPGSYVVRFSVTTLQAGQLQLEIGEGFDIKRSRNSIVYKPVVSSTATNQNCVSGGLLIIGEDCVQVERENSVIRLVNPATNAESVLQVAGSNKTTLKQPRVHWISIQKMD